jgi:hypothetical protein
VDNTRDDILESTSKCVVNVLTISNYSPLNIEQSWYDLFLSLITSRYHLYMYIEFLYSRY